MKYSQASDSGLALDLRSVRTMDGDGHMHVAVSNISKATVNPYLGKEIPRWQELGLDPNKIYRLLRAPDEIKAGAQSFAGKPLLIVHKPLNAEDHPYQKVVGAVGTDVKFDGTYLKAPLTIWPQDATDLVQSGKQRELSCGYKYDADMTPGTWRGQNYDGVMRNIRGNHVAIVTEGRAGPDVVIGDSKEIVNMKIKMSPKARIALSEVNKFLGPLLAQDAKVDLTPGFRGLTAWNFKAKAPLLAQYVAESIKGKLLTGVAMAQDATPEGLHVLLEALSMAGPGEEEANLLGKAEAGDPALGAAEQGEGGPGAEPRLDADPGLEGMGGGEEGMEGEMPPGIEGIKTYLQQCLSPEQYAKLEEMLKGLGDGEEEMVPGSENEGDPNGGETEYGDGEEDGQDAPPPFKGMPRVGGKDKRMHGMDAAAVRDVVSVAVSEERQRQKALRDAERDVKPYVGEIIGCDSAGDVYRRALSIKGVEVEDLRDAPVKTLRAMLHREKLPGRIIPPSDAAIAQDAARAKSHAERFPSASRIGRA
jgi:hypothetical protein